MVLGDGVGDFLEKDGFAGSRRRDDEHALTFADGRDQIDDAHVEVFGIVLEDQAAAGMQRCQVFKVADVGDAFGVFAVDGFDAEEREITFGFLGGTDLSLDDVPVAQAEASDLAGADVDVVGAGEIVVFGATEKPEAVGENFQDAFAVHQAVLADAGAQNLEDEVLFLEADVIGDSLFLGDVVQFVHVHGLEVFDVEFSAFDLFVFGVGFGVKIGDVLARARGGFAGLFFGGFFGRWLRCGDGGGRLLATFVLLHLIAGIRMMRAAAAPSPGAGCLCHERSPTRT